MVFRSTALSALALTTWLSRPPYVHAQQAQAEARGQTQVEDPWWGRDKALHFGASATIAGATYATAALFSDERANARASWAIWGASVGLAAGVGKEVADLAGAGHASFRDVAWDVLGVAAGVGIAWAVDTAARAIFGANDVPAPRPAFADPNHDATHVLTFSEAGNVGRRHTRKPAVAVVALSPKEARRLNLIFVGLKVFPRKPAASLTGGALLYEETPDSTDVLAGSHPSLVLRRSHWVRRPR